MPDEDTLWTMLRAAASVDRVPDSVREAARASLAWRDPDSALATLIGDSAQMSDSELLAGVRGAGGPRLLTFSTDHFTVEVEVNSDGRTVSLVGQVAPADAARVLIDHRDGVLETRADDLGRFTASGVSEGPVRLRFTSGQGASTAFRTDWVLL
jgi:hypothetical protein